MENDVRRRRATKFLSYLSSIEVNKGKFITHSSDSVCEIMKKCVIMKKKKKRNEMNVYTIQYKVY